jgi:hypothetical protein
MTGDERERAIDFILKSRARAGARLATRQERTEATVDRLSRKVEALVKIVEEERNGGR